MVACTRGHAYTCACKFRQTVKPAITTILPACRWCQHRDETTKDSGPGTSDKPGFHPTNKQHGARTTTTRLQQNGPRSQAQDGQRTPISGECRDKRTRRNIRSVHSRCRRPRPSCIHGNQILQPPHAYPKRAGNPGRAASHASTTPGPILTSRGGENNSPDRNRQIRHIRGTTTTRQNALAECRYTRSRHGGPSRPTPGKWSE